MNSKLITLALLGITTGVLYSGELMAWQRTAKKECTQDYKDCQKDADKCTKSDKSCKRQSDSCKRDKESCMKDVERDDMDEFREELSDLSLSQFEKFTPDQKKKAMDYADNNKMKPDDAVQKVLNMKK
jgi:hypothetical protein